MATRCKQFCCLLHTSFPKFDPCISREKKTKKKTKKTVDVSPKHTCLAKALQNCETIEVLHCIFCRLCFCTSDQTYPLLRAYTAKKSCTRSSNKSKKISNIEQRIINVNNISSQRVFKVRKIRLLS